MAASTDRVTLPTRGHTAALAGYSRRRAFFWLGNKIAAASVSYAEVYRAGETISLKCAARHEPTLDSYLESIRNTPNRGRISNYYSAPLEAVARITTESLQVAILDESLVQLHLLQDLKRCGQKPKASQNARIVLGSLTIMRTPIVFLFS
jgi:hypothetical protein